MSDLTIKCRKPLHSRSDSRGTRSPTIELSPSRSPRLNQIRDEPSEENLTDSLDEENLTSGTISDTDDNTTFDETQSSPKSTNKHRVSVSQRRTSNQLEKPRLSQPTTNNLNFPFKLLLYSFIIILPLLTCARLLVKQQQSEKICTFENLKQKHPPQSSDVWKALQINIELLLNKKLSSPNIYLFVYSNKSHKKSLQVLIQEIALEASKCFGHQRPVELTLNDFQIQDGDDYGYPIEQYKKKLKEGNVFLIVNLNQITPNSARALHTICDTYSPISKDVVIFLSLRTHLSVTAGSPSQIAYKTLRELWKQIPENELDALISRVGDQVLLLQA